MTIDEQWHRDVDKLLEAFTQVDHLVEADLPQSALHVMISALREQEASDPRIRQIYLTSIQTMTTVSEILSLQKRKLVKSEEEIKAQSLQVKKLSEERLYLLAYNQHQSTQIIELLRWSLKPHTAMDADFLRAFAVPLIRYIEALAETLQSLLGKDGKEIEAALNPLKSYLVTLQPIAVLTTPLDDMPLSAREIQVLKYLVRGLSAAEIGAELRVQASTIRTYQRRIKKKLDIHHLPGLVKYALRHNLTTLDS